MKGRYVIACSILLATVMFIIVWDKQPTIYTYLILALLAGILLAVAILYGKGKWTSPAAVFAVFLIAFLLIPNIWFISNHYAALQPGDVSCEYAIVNTFSDYGKAFIVPPTLDSMRLPNYSAYPPVHILAVTIGQVANIDDHILAMIIPSILAFAGFLLLYLLLSRLTGGLHLSKALIPLSLLIYAIAPEAVFNNLRFVRQGLAIVLVLALFYLIYRFILTRDWRTGALIVFIVIVLAPVHHFSSFIVALYLLSFFVLAVVLFLLGRRLAKFEWRNHLQVLSKRCLFIGIAGVIGIVAFLGWNRGATITLYPSQEILASYEAATTAETATTAEAAELPTEAMAPRVIETGAERAVGSLTEVEELEIHIPEAYYPDELIPPWVHILKIRDFLVFVPVFVGFGWLIRRKLKKQFSSYEELVTFSLFIFSLAVFGTFFLFNLFTAKVVPYRIVLLSLPFIALGSSMVYGEILHRRRLVAAVVLVFIVTCGFLGLWGHRVVPIHVYSTSVSASAVGDAMPLDARHYALGKFIDEQNLDKGVSRIISADSSRLYPLLSPQSYSKVGPFRRIQIVQRLDEAISNNEAVVVTDFDQSVYTYATGHTLELEEAEMAELQYRTTLETKLNRIYNNGFTIWRR